MHKRTCLLLVGLTFGWTHRAPAQSTIFTYQGRLAVNSSPANGFYDIQFTIYKVQVSGVAIAGPLTNTAVGVTNGLFITSLDFGNQPFLGVNRWLDIAVRTNGGAVGFTPLVPRVRIASAPYAIAAANVIDGAVTPSSLQPGPGLDGQVLKMSNGVLTWATDLTSGGSVTSVGTGLGLSGGPITNVGVLSINPTAVPLLTSNQTFTGSNTFAGVSTLTNANNRFAGAFFGNGAGLTNITATATNPVTLAGDATGPAGANTVARIRGVNVLATAPAAGQHLRFSGTDWSPSLVALGTDVSGTLADARLSANVALLSANQTFAASNTFNGVSAMTNANNHFAGTFSGNGTGLTALSAANIAAGTLADARLSANVALLSANQTFAGSNTFNGVSSMTNVNNRFIGAFIGNGAGLTNVTATATNAVTLSGDVTGPAASTTVARIRGVNVLATAPTAGQHLRFGGTDWTPGQVALGTDVAGSLAVANGGTAATTAAGARASLGAAASGLNADITSLTGLSTPLAATQGGSGLSSYSVGDLLFASAANTLSRRSIGAVGQVLTVSNALPAWVAANNHNHFSQFWTGVGVDGLFVENTSSADGASALTGSATGTSGLQYGVFGQSASTNGTGVEGFAYATNGTSTGVYGESTSTNGTGVFGVGSAVSGVPVGVYGEADAPLGIGVYGFGAATIGEPVGVYGVVASATGYGFYTTNRLYVGGNATIVSNLNVGAVYASAASAAFPGLAFVSSPRAGLFNPATNILACSTAGAERLRIDAAGKVGLGRAAATNIFEVEGNASKTVAGSWLANSDARIKTSVHPLQHALETIDRVRPVSFHYTAEYRAAHPSIQDKRYYNVIAQEFAEVFPEAVGESGENLDGKPILQVDDHPAVISAIAAIQELHGLVRAKDAELARLKEQNTALEQRLQSLEKTVANLAP